MEKMEHLVQMALKGDTDAFVKLIENSQDTLKRVSFAWLKDENDVADAIQDTILDAFANIGQLRKAEYFKTWLVKILINNCTKIYRRNRKLLQFEVSADRYQEENWLGDVREEALGAKLEFFDLLKILPEDSRVIFQMYFGEQFTIAEIAEILHMKENTVKSRIHRGKTQLREQMEKEKRQAR
ncbi:MAG: sigma-70 family RNA polymerase sigma factor [Lachnospiraceae bacterium]|nr:sigma-70 family RNA polymerase sigma factor [Lachnospiraceae bacterium]